MEQDRQTNALDSQGHCRSKLRPVGAIREAPAAADEIHAVGALLRFSRAVAHARLPSEVFPLLAHAAATSLDAASAAVLVDDDDGALKCIACHGVRLEEWAKARPFITSDGIDLNVAPFARISGPDGEFFGIVTVDIDRGRRWDADDRDLLAALADRAAMAFTRMARLEALRRSEVELTTAREVLERTHALALLGEMAAGIVHDLRNILSPLSLHLQFLRRQLRQSGRATVESLEEMQSILRRGTEVTERLRLFSKHGSGTTCAVSVDLNELARRALVVARPYASTRNVAAHLHERLAATSPVSVAPEDGVAVVANLILNAIDAVSSGGNVTVSTGERPGETFLSVSDDGVGITPEVRARMFDPFFTTKGDAGTGLGLSMAHTFAQRHGADLRVDTTPGRGTTMTLAFRTGGSISATDERGLKGIS